MNRTHSINSTKRLISGIIDRIIGSSDHRIIGSSDHRITGSPDHRIDQPAPASSHPADRLTSPSLFPAQAGIHITRRLRSSLFRFLLCLPLLLGFAAPATAQTASLTINPTQIPAASLNGATITLIPKNATFMSAGGSGGTVRNYIHPDDLNPDPNVAGLKNPTGEARLSAEGLALITLSGAPSGLTIASGKLLAREATHSHGGATQGHRSAQITLAYSGSPISVDDPVTVTVTGGKQPKGLLRFGNQQDVTFPPNLSATFTIKGGGTQPAVSFSSAAFSVAESVGTHNVTVNLSSPAPAGGLTLNYSATGGTATAGSDYTTLPGTVTIPANATTVNIPVAITDDSEDDDNETIILTVTSGTGYTLGSPTVHTLTIIDNDDPPPGTPALTLSQNTLTLTEGTTGNYTIELATEPTATVTVAIVSTNTDITISPSSPLTFTTANWDTAQIVTVTAGQDDDTTHDSATLTHTASGGDYGAVTGSVTLTINDNDVTTTNPGPTAPPTNPGSGNNNNNNNTPPVVTPPVIPPVSVSAQALTLTEGAMESYTLVLDSAPTTSVTIEITPQDSTRITVTPSTVVFTPDNWQNPQSVSVRATDDSAATGQTVQLNHTLAGSEQIIDSVTITIQKRAVITDEIPTTPWVSRMGRTLAEQAIDGIRNRMNASRTPGLTATLAGWSVPMHSSSGESLDSETYPLHPTDGQTLNAQDIFSNSQFIHTTGLDLRGGNTAFWGQLSETDFSGTQHDLHTQGESRTLNIGADYVVHDWMTGISLLSNSTKGTQQRQAITERMESNLTALIPYSARETGETRIWGAAGFGQGTVSRYREDRKSNPSDVTWQMLNLGVSSEIRTTETATLSLDTDALWVRTQSDESRQDNMNPSISRIRAGLQSTWNHTLYNTELQPSLTVGVRHDGGGAESGFGLYAGSGLHWTSATVQMDIEGQVVLSHQQEIEESGFSASLIHDANPHSDLGFSLSLSQASLLTIDGLDSWYLQESLMPTTNDSRWSMDAAYGLSAWEGRFTGSPHIGLGLSGDSRDIQLGWRMTPLATNQNLSLGIQATRLTQEQTAPKHWFGVEARVRW